VFKDGWEYNLILAVLAVLVAVTGPGRWSLDHALDLTDDLNGGTGLLISLVGLVASIALLAFFWKPVAPTPSEQEPASQ
jgi:putative oxidoreductase